MIFTNVSWLGDFFKLWPVASWYYKTYGVKIHFVVSKNYYMYEKVKTFLEYQEFCDKVTLIDIGSNAWDTSNWIFNPADYGIHGSYYNFGFYKGIDINMSQYYAEYNGLDYDKDMELKLIEFPEAVIPEKVTIKIAHQEGVYWEVWRDMMPTDVQELDLNDSFELNVYKAYHARERHLGSSSLSIMMDMLKKPMIVYAGNGFPEHVFYNNKHKIIKV